MKVMRGRETTSDLPHSLVHLMGQANTAVWQFITQKTYAIGGITGMQASVLLLLTCWHSTRPADLIDKGAVLNGAASGIGLALAVQAARQGMGRR